MPFDFNSSLNARCSKLWFELFGNVFILLKKGIAFHQLRDVMIRAVPSLTTKMEWHSCLLLMMNSEIHSLLMLMRSIGLHLNALNLTPISNLPPKKQP